MRRYLPISEQLRTAINNSGVSRYRIAKSIDIDAPAITRFMGGRSGLSLATIDRIGELLGLELTGAGAGQRGTLPRQRRKTAPNRDE